MIKLPPLPEPDGWAGKDWYHRPATTLADFSKFELEQARYTADQLRARDLEVARVVLESAAQAAELWHANGLEVEIAREIRNLKVSHD